MTTEPSDNTQVGAATGYDPVWEAFLNAPLDDEPLTEADKQAIKEAEEDIAAGRLKSLKEVRRELGL